LLPQLTIEGTSHHHGAPPNEIEELVPVGPGGSEGQ
jgi:hypothetical protein